MGHNCCCVVNCKNNGTNSRCKFYTFPTAAWKLDQRNKWIAAVKRKNVDGSPWSPKPHDTICSEHFIGGKKSDAQASPSYVPTIFPTVYRKKIGNSQALARYTRLIKRRPIIVSDTTLNEIKKEGNELNQTQPLVVNQGCQVNMFSESNLRETTFICNRLIYSNHCDAEIQVDIAKTSRIVTTNNSRKKDKSCGTDKKLYKHQSTETKSQEFVGISSIKNDQQLLDLAGVSYSDFEFLLTKLAMKKCSFSTKDGLLIFLMKMKTGLSFSALSVLFGVHRTTISRIHNSILHNLASETTNLVLRPDRATVQATIP
ncbi:uncharacterized protein ACR2FA_005297 [Aphomia sociella]